MSAIPEDATRYAAFVADLNRTTDRDIEDNDLRRMVEKLNPGLRGCGRSLQRQVWPTIAGWRRALSKAGND